VWHTIVQSTTSVRRGATQGHNCAKAIAVRWVGKAKGTTNGHDCGECDDTIVQGLGASQGRQGRGYAGMGGEGCTGMPQKSEAAWRAGAVRGLGGVLWGQNIEAHLGRHHDGMKGLGKCRGTTMVKARNM
jgi:hypothetical protein